MIETRGSRKVAIQRSSSRSFSLRRRKIALRRLMRVRRKQASPAFCQTASETICRMIRSESLVIHSSRIALYVATRNEVNLELLLSGLPNKAFYWPKIRAGRKKAMSFVAAREDYWQLNRYGIPEPLGYDFVPRWTLDLVFLPLLAFDRRGGRLGMGGGYYDRAFAFCRIPHSLGRTLLIGVAYAFQEVKKVPREKSDVRLDYIVTEEGFRSCSTH